MDWLRSRQEGLERALARHGYSRDGKRGKLPIKFGLRCDAGGCPMAVEVFAGNPADPTTVEPPIEKLRARFGRSKVVLVGDRGMLTEARIREEVKEAAWTGSAHCGGRRSARWSGLFKSPDEEYLR